MRTVYRDIADLGASGVPIIGEAGIGYQLSRHHVVRPLMFGLEELDALALGAQMVQSWADHELAQAARRVLDKITVVLPESLRGEFWRRHYFPLPAPPNRRWPSILSPCADPSAQNIGLSFFIAAKMGIHRNAACDP